MKVTALDVPPAVVIATCAEEEVDAGTVTLQVFWAGQLVGATSPLNVATIWPLELRKLDPATTMACPAEPLAGESEEMTGGPPATAVGVVEVVPLRPLVDVDVDVPTTTGEGGDGPVFSDTTSALAAATTRAATTAMDPISQ